MVPGKVVRLTQFGAFVELREGLEGLCHVSEMGDEHRSRGKSPLKVGTAMPFRVLRVSAEEHKVGLSLKEVDEHIQTPSSNRNDKADAIAPAPLPPASTTMGEKMAQAIRAAAVVSAAKRGNEAPAQAEASAVAIPPAAADPPAQASATAAAEVGGDSVAQTAEVFSSEPLLPQAEPAATPETSPAEEAAIETAAASMSEPMLDTHVEVPPNGGQGVSVEAVSSAPQAEAPADPGTGAENAPADANINKETLPAGSQS